MSKEQEQWQTGKEATMANKISIRFFNDREVRVLPFFKHLNTSI
jgi:hypothetical protein